MADVDSSYAAALKAESAVRVVVLPEAAKWGERGRTIAFVSPFATEAAAAAEGERQLAFAGAPVARDVAIVPGRRRDLHLRPITLVGDRLDYAAGVAAFVIAFEELENGTTKLTVLRRVG